ncbi:translation initiation factor IF-2 N-terminal domain-containing protein [Corynebacterium tapiri]|nr:Rne/Rng family ribonuclease [Corynebacterium tapiri]
MADNSNTHQAWEQIAHAANTIDRAELGSSIRVYVLAKKLGVSSRQLTNALAENGERKVAQSSLSMDVVDALFATATQRVGATEKKEVSGEAGEDAAPAKKKPARKRSTKSASKATKKTTTKSTKKAEEPQDEEPQAEESTEKTAKKTTKRSTKRTTKKPAKKASPAKKQEDAPAKEEQVDEEKLRERVRKNVENEIHQIEEKVAAELLNASESDLEEVAPEITPAPQDDDSEADEFAPVFVAPADGAAPSDEKDGAEEESESGKGRRGRRRSARRKPASQRKAKEQVHVEEPETEETETEEPATTEPVAIKGSTRLEAQRRRRSEMREAGKSRKHIVSQAEFLARRESVNRTMVVRERERTDRAGALTQIGVLEDGMLVEHFVTSDEQTSMIGNIYLGRVQNVLPSMEAAFIDIGTGRNGVLYASDIDFKALGQRTRSIEQALKSGDQILVQVSKDPLGHKGPRLTTQVSLAGRFLVYVPGGRSAGISRKLPAPERKRLKEILGRVIPGKGGAIIRTAAENTSEEAIATDVKRLHTAWENITERAEKLKAKKGAKPATLYEEPETLIKVIRDVFNEDFSALIVEGDRVWNKVSSYVGSVAPDLKGRLERYHAEQHGDRSSFEEYRVDEQLQKALARKVWLPSGGHLVIDHTEAMVVIDVNTGRFTGSGGNLEETVTRNNLEAAEEIVRQMRLRDLGGMIVVDFIDMVLPENQDLVLRRLKEALGRDRTRHQVSEVTSLGLVQMTRKRLGTGLLETFASTCENCVGRGLIVHDEPVDPHAGEREHDNERAAHHAPREHEAPRKRASSNEDLERLADSVLSVDAEEDSEEENASRRSSRRRGRRGGNRGRGARNRRDAQHEEHAEGADTLSEVEQIAAAAVDTATRLDPEEPSDADYVGDEQAFQAAVAEFEASPRRKRRTRGNSVSDRRPRREDFVMQPQAAEPAVEEVAEDSAKDEARSSSRTRGRRRAVRRAATSKNKAVKQHAQSSKARESAEKPSASASGGRRRRATRRSPRR